MSVLSIIAGNAVKAVTGISPTTWIMVAVVAAALGAGMTGGYKWGHAPVPGLEKQVASLTKELKDLKDAADKQHDTAQTGVEAGTKKADEDVGKTKAAVDAALEDFKRHNPTGNRGCIAIKIPAPALITNGVEVTPVKPISGETIEPAQITVYSILSQDAIAAMNQIIVSAP